MSGSIDYSPPPATLSDSATPLVVCRYDQTADPGQRYEILPNVRVEQVQFKDQAEPATVQFSYILGDSGFSSFPSQFEALWPINSPPNPYKVQAGDELVVLYIDYAGNYRVLWHGFAQLPQVDVAGRSQAVTFVGAHVSVRLWDVVVMGRWQRQGDKPEQPGDGEDDTNPFETDLPTRFNPDDKPNCTPDGTDEEDEESGDQWPVFLEPGLAQVDGSLLQTYWDLGKFTRYLLWYYNNEEFVKNPDFDQLAELLSSRRPKKGQQFYDPNNPSTYDETPIVLRDFDATNRPMPEVLEQQLGYNGFRMRFVCEGKAAEGYDAGVIVEEPVDRIEIYRFDSGTSADPKWLFLGSTGATLDPALDNLAAFQAVNDFHSLANQWSVETRPIRYEVAVLLAPGFQPAAGDESPGTRKQWLASNQDSADEGTREKYRLYIGDECSEGNWNLVLKKWQTNAPLLLADVFEDKDINPGGDYVKRYRPGINTLFSLDPSNKPYKAQLQVSRDYNGLAPPCLWDGTGTWQAINGGWRLLRDRLGIMITVENPMEWDIGKPDPATGTPQEPSGVLDAVTSIANPATGSSASQRQRLFYLMLTVVIEGDQMLQALAKARPATPYPFVIWRQVDCKDHFVKQVVDQSSPYYKAPTTQDEDKDIPVPELDDDTKQAQAYADRMRAYREFPPISAAATIPWFSRAYSLGDRIEMIAGRDASLQQNSGGEQGEAPSYPYVVGISHVFTGGQKTVLQLADRRQEPDPMRHSHSSGRGRGH